jgi:hypothetical protein
MEATGLLPGMMYSYELVDFCRFTPCTTVDKCAVPEEDQIPLVTILSSYHRLHVPNY